MTSTDADYPGSVAGQMSKHIGSHALRPLMSGLNTPVMDGMQSLTLLSTAAETGLDGRNKVAAGGPQVPRVYNASNKAVTDEAPSPEGETSTPVQDAWNKAATDGARLPEEAVSVLVPDASSMAVIDEEQSPAACHNLAPDA